MIASLSGTITHITAEALVVEVGGIGIATQYPNALGSSHVVGDHVVLSTSLVVREDSLTLYGFPNADYRDVFDTLQSVSGVGPRLALGVLSALTPDQLRAAVHSADEATLTKVSGIGRKGAQRMVLELTDKLPRYGPGSAVDVREAAATPANNGNWQAPVRDALLSLGWLGREADEAIAVVEAEREAVGSAPVEPAQEVSKMLALALRTMSRAKGGI